MQAKVSAWPHDTPVLMLPLLPDETGDPRRISAGLLYEPGSGLFGSFGGGPQDGPRTTVICNASHNRQLTTAGNPGGGARTPPLDPQAMMRCAGNGRRPGLARERRRGGGGEIVTSTDVVAPVTERGPEAETAVLTVNGQARDER